MGPGGDGGITAVCESSAFHSYRRATPASPSILQIENKFAVGGDEEDRTPDLRIANATLSQLSYVPTLVKF